MRNIFLEKSYTKRDGEAIPRRFCRKSKSSVALDQEFTQFVFIVCQVEDCRSILKINCRPIALTSYKAFPKDKKRSGTSLSASFSA